MKIKEYLGDAQFYKKTAVIALPIAMQSLITIGVNLVDNIMVGQLGEVVMSACSQAVQIVMLFHICCMGLGMGASVMVSRFWGMRDITSLKKVVTLMLRFTIVIGSIFTLLTIIIPRNIMLLYTPEEPVVEQGLLYLKWMVPCFLLTGLVTTCTIVLRSIGQTKIPLIGSVFAFFINIGANWIFIFGKFGVPAMGIEGAAIGTLISRIFEFTYNFGYFILIDKKIAYRVKDFFSKCNDMMRDYLTISIPVLISDMILGFGTSAVAMVMGRIGNVFVAANSITTVTQQLSTALIQGVSQAGCIVTGHSLGEGHYEKAKKQAWTFLIFGLVIGAFAGIFIMCIGDFIISFYNVEQESKEMASELMKAIGVIVIFQATNSIITKGVLRGGGDTKCLMVADNIFLWVFSIPLGILSGLVLQLPPFWIYFCLKMDQFLKTFWCIWRIKSGKWVKKISAKEEIG